MQVFGDFAIVTLVGLHGLRDQLARISCSALTREDRRASTKHSAVTATASQSRKPKCVYTMFGNPTLSSRLE